VKHEDYYPALVAEDPGELLQGLTGVLEIVQQVVAARAACLCWWAQLGSNK